MVIVAVDNLKIHRFLILVSWQQAFTSLAIGHSLQILDCSGLGALVGWISPYPLSSPTRNSWTTSEGVMLASDTASTWRFFFCTLDQWPQGKSATMSFGLQLLILAFPILRGTSCLNYQDLSSWHISQLWYYPDHMGKWTFSLFYWEEELFWLSRRVLAILTRG